MTMTGEAMVTMGLPPMGLDPQDEAKVYRLDNAVASTLIAAGIHGRPIWTCGSRKDGIPVLVLRCVGYKTPVFAINVVDFRRLSETDIVNQLKQTLAA